MGKFLDAIEAHRDLAESRGFEIGPINVNGDVRVLLERKVGAGYRYYGFPTTSKTATFLRELPELPCFEVRVTLSDDTTTRLRIYEKDSYAATAVALKRARDLGRDYRLKSLEVVSWPNS